MSIPVRNEMSSSGCQASARLLKRCRWYLPVSGLAPLMPPSRFRSSRNPIPHERAFWAMAAIADLPFAISAVPSPLYSLYQDMWASPTRS